MEKLNKLTAKKTGPTIPAIPSVERRMFLRSFGIASATTLALLSSCSQDNLVAPGKTLGRSGARTGASVLPDGSIDLGSGDIGISNLAYTLDQLEVAFYMTAVEKTSGLSELDRKVLVELHDHEVVHREFFKTLLGDNAIPMLDFDFSGIDFNQRNAVFDAAQKFEDVGVGAFNGTGPLIQDAEILKIAGKMVSVEARHATLARHMLQPRTYFSLGHELIDDKGLDHHLTPEQVLAKAQRYIKQKISAVNLPKM
ncbi:ferritin-like domain-containing protein [Larkinella terrae]|uniref:Ferritin-like domain-containing protein n=1 Tax=Larkinella terrae TaxID=2025311 RepID=A0A7K0ECJ8_9BACT|nr:ferritin-like domain-containing protein [Larkinella terrae]MRS59690.1 ferritin-like domain-containing protein [Larkinella terrae]